MTDVTNPSTDSPGLPTGEELIERARAYLHEQHGRWGAVRARTGLSNGSMTRIYNGQVKDPGVHKIMRLLKDCETASHTAAESDGERSARTGK